MVKKLKSLQSPKYQDLICAIEIIFHPSKLMLFHRNIWCMVLNDKKSVKVNYAAISIYSRKPEKDQYCRSKSALKLIFQTAIYSGPQK